MIGDVMLQANPSMGGDKDVPVGDKKSLTDLLKSTFNMPGVTPLVDEIINWATGAGLTVINPDIIEEYLKQKQMGGVAGGASIGTQANEVLNRLLKLSDHLDNKGFYKEADYIDSVINEHLLRA